MEVFISLEETMHGTKVKVLHFSNGGGVWDADIRTLPPRAKLRYFDYLSFGSEDLVHLRGYGSSCKVLFEQLSASPVSLIEGSSIIRSRNVNCGCRLLSVAASFAAGE